MNLIYMCIFHQSNYINLLKLLITSISKKADINKETTDILIITSPSFQPLIQKELDENTDLSLYYYILDLNTLFEAGCARLNIFKYDNIEKYSKILYLDTDILINSDINVLLSLELFTDKIYALEEDNIGSANHGSNFFDFKKYNKNTKAFTSGILLFRNSDSIKSLFDTIQSHITEYIYVKKNRIPDCLDQPFIIYNAITQNKYDNQVLNKYAENNPSKVSSEKIIYHFPGGPGDYASKFSKMNTFWNKMKDVHPVLKVNIYEDIKTQPVKNTLLSLIGICVSYQYFDTLKFMLPVNYLHFEKIYLITQEDDIQTIDFCKQFENVKVLFYDFKNNSKKFDKYGALNYVQKIVYSEYPESWYLIIDSDIILPNNVIDILVREKLNPECIYGTFRYNVSKSSELLNKKKIIKDNSNWPYNNILHEKNTPPSIMGCFQLYKKKDIYHSSKYYDSAGFGDYDFGYNNFNLFCSMESMFILHLGESNQHNWFGKKTYFIDDINICLKDIYYTCNILCTNNYYNKNSQIVKYGNNKNIYEDIWTCSDEMRLDISDFFKDKSHFKIAEIGSHKGYTTKILSQIFSKVYAVDNNIEWTNFNKDYNKDRTNIEYIMLDIYKNDWNILPNDIDISFIDACHSYESCRSDILNSIKRFTKLKYIIFDDYGVWEGVKKIIDEMINDGTLIFERFIGLINVPGPNGIVKNTNEGIICRINLNKKYSWDNSHITFLENKKYSWDNSHITFLENKKYSWNDSYITFLENGKMNAFGKGTYTKKDKYKYEANFGGRIHTLTFNNDYTEFTSIRHGDSEIVKGTIII